jgi:O-antigen ligase
MPATMLIFVPANYDVFNIPKLSLGIILVLLYVAYLSQTNILGKNKLKRNWPYLASMSVITLATINSSDISSAVLGNYQQNTGWLLLAAGCLLVWAISQDQNILFPKFIWSLIFAGLGVSGYAILQKFNLDPVDWAFDGWITSSLGNPNFTGTVSAIIAMTCVYQIDSKKTKNQNFFLILAAILNILSVFFADSDQGYLILMLGIVLLAFFWLKKRSVQIAWTTLGLLATFFIVLASYFVKFSSQDESFITQSLEFRKFYWYTGIKIFSENWIAGTGFGDFQDEFFKHRNVDHFLSGKGEFPASAHNYFIEFLALGGAPLGVAYLSFVIYITFLLINLINKNNPNQTHKFAPLSFLWLAYNIQSLVSIPIVPIVLLGFITAGLIIQADRYEITDKQPTGKKLNEIMKDKPFLKVSMSIVCLAIIPIMWNLNYKEFQLKNTIDFVPKTQVELSEKLEFNNHLLNVNLNYNEHKYLVAKNLFNQGLGLQAAEVMKETLGNKLHLYNKTWYLAYFYKNQNSLEKSLPYFEKLVDLDPNNLDIRKDYILILRGLNLQKESFAQEQYLKEKAPDSKQYFEIK